MKENQNREDQQGQTSLHLEIQLQEDEENQEPGRYQYTWQRVRGLAELDINSRQYYSSSYPTKRLLETEPKC
jgi:hypothetical protein